MEVGWIVYYALGFFFAAGVLTGLLSFAEEIKTRVGYQGSTKQTWVWIAMLSAGAFIPLWFPFFLFALFVVFWMVVIRTFKKHVRVDLKKIIPNDTEV